MIFEETKLKGAFVIKPEKREDERGFFARTFDQNEFNDHGLNANVVQCSVSFNKKKGTFRGLHYQEPPYEEEKIVTCMQGALLDFVVDLRPDSLTYKQAISIELSQQNGYLLYIPKTCAHGFQTLMDSTQIFYQITQFYSPNHQRGVRFNDPAFDIHLPLDILSIAERDKTYPDYNEPIHVSHLWR